MRRKPRHKCAYPPCPNKTPRASSKYCRRQCCALDQIGKPHDTSAANAANRLRTAKRIIRFIVEECRPYLDANRRMPLDQVVRVVLKYRKIGYARGYTAHYQQRTRDWSRDVGPSRPSIQHEGVSPS